MNTRSIAIAILKNKENQFLLQNREGMSKYGEQWAFFGGQVEEGETPEQAVVRELQEELSLELHNPTLLFSSTTPETRIDGEQEELTQHVFSATISEDQIKNLHLQEGKSMQWFSKEELKDLKLVPSIDVFLEKIKLTFAVLHQTVPCILEG